MSNWTYMRTEPSLWTVGFYGPDDKWHPDSDHGSTDEAAARVRWLNGGADESLLREIGDLRSRIDAALELCDVVDTVNGAPHIADKFRRVLDANAT